jgi:hypothetical protein
LSEYQQARTLCEDTIRRRRRILADEHPDTLLSANSLADVRAVEVSNWHTPDTWSSRSRGRTGHCDMIGAAYRRRFR